MANTVHLDISFQLERNDGWEDAADVNANASWDRRKRGIEREAGTVVRGMTGWTFGLARRHADNHAHAVSCREERELPLDRRVKETAGHVMWRCGWACCGGT